MFICSGKSIRVGGCLIAVLLAASATCAAVGASWNGVLSDAAGKPVAGAIVVLHSASGSRDYTTTTAANGKFGFGDIAAGSYEVSVRSADKDFKAAAPLVVKDASLFSMSLQ